MNDIQIDERADEAQHVVVVGGGFGGLEVARRLRHERVRVTLIDRRNFHLFQPLLYQVATGGLSPANIATPLRYIVRRQKNCEVLLGSVADFDVANRRVLLRDGHVPYDCVVLAAGATHSYFGHDQWAPLAPGLKTVEDAFEIRRRIFLAFEAAERHPEPTRRGEWMTFVIVGGGPTGVELAGSLAEIARHTLRHDFRNIDPAEARIVLVEAAEHILEHFGTDLSLRATAKVRALGIEVRTKTKVIDVRPDRVLLESADGIEELETRTVLWGAGVQANPLARRLALAAGVEVDRGGRIPVCADLTLEGHPEIFAIGDIARCLDADGKPLPGLAPVAMQQGMHVASLIAARARGDLDEQAPGHAFRYRDRGTMATIGRSKAVAKIGRWGFCGFFAWQLWLLVHLLQIVAFENRLLVLLQWAWRYITYDRSARLITEVTRRAGDESAFGGEDGRPA